MAAKQRFRLAPAFAIVEAYARKLQATSSATFGRQCTVRGKGVRGDREGRGGARGTTPVCTAAGRWVRSVSTVRELDRASGPLVGPVPTRLCTQTQIDTHIHIRRASVQLHRSCTDTDASELPLAPHLSLSLSPSFECTLGASAYACARECACTRVCDTLPVSQCVRQERCIALRRCVKASENTRSLGLFARLSFPPSLSLLPLCSSGPSLLARQAPLPRGSRSLFSVSVTPPKGPPLSRLRPPFLPRASLHLDCIVSATAIEKALR